MEPNQALTILVQAAELANKRGAFSLDEAGQIAQAVALFKQPAPAPQGEGKDEVTQEPSKPKAKQAKVVKLNS